MNANMNGVYIGPCNNVDATNFRVIFSEEHANLGFMPHICLRQGCMFIQQMYQLILYTRMLQYHLEDMHPGPALPAR